MASTARGYGNFFNIGEGGAMDKRKLYYSLNFPCLEISQWKALETHTTAPYVLTLKSNGCIIFIAPLTKSKLLITSKHSIGPVKRQDQKPCRGW